MLCAALYRMVREGLIEDVIIAQGPKEAVGIGHTGIWQNAFQEERRKCSGLRQECAGPV